MKYSIICQIDGRVVASLSLDGELKIYHDHFSDVDEFEVQKFIEALDKWAVRRTISHNSKKGLNLKTLEALNKLQNEKPGKILIN